MGSVGHHIVCAASVVGVITIPNLHKPPENGPDTQLTQETKTGQLKYESQITQAICRRSAVNLSFLGSDHILPSAMVLRFLWGWYPLSPIQSRSSEKGAMPFEPSSMSSSPAWAEPKTPTSAWLPVGLLPDPPPRTP